MNRSIRKTKPIFRQTLKRKDHKVLKRLALAFAIVLVSGVLYLKFLAPHTLEAKQRIQLESTTHQLQNTKKELEQQQVKDADTQKKLEETNKQLLETQKQLQAKRDAQSAVAYAAEAPVQNTYQGGGNKEVWMAAAGIPQDQWWAVDYIVSRESGWNPCAFYPGKSDCNATPATACGLVQSLPCSKLGPNWTDPVAALKWQYAYVNGAKFDPYGGGYVGAVNYWKAHGNY